MCIPSVRFSCCPLGLECSIKRTPLIICLLTIAAVGVTLSVMYGINNPMHPAFFSGIGVTTASVVALVGSCLFTLDQHDARLTRMESTGQAQRELYESSLSLDQAVDKFFSSQRTDQEVGFVGFCALWRKSTVTAKQIIARVIAKETADSKTAHRPCQFAMLTALIQTARERYLDFKEALLPELAACSFLILQNVCKCLYPGELFSMLLQLKNQLVEGQSVACTAFISALVNPAPALEVGWAEKMASALIDYGRRDRDFTFLVLGKMSLNTKKKEEIRQQLMTFSQVVGAPSTLIDALDKKLQ